MTLQAELARLDECLTGLRNAIVELRDAARDKPEQGDLVLVDVYADGADDLLGWLEEASEALSLAREALVCHPGLLEPIGQVLLVCQERLGRVANRLDTDLASYPRMAELVVAAARRGAAWQRWATDVSGTLDWCRPPLLESQQRLLACWSEITDRLGASPMAHQVSGGERL